MNKLESALSQIGSPLRLRKLIQELLATDITTHAALLTGTHGEINSILTADQTVNNSTTLVNITGLVAALEANKLYAILAALCFATGAVPDIKWAWTVPTGATFQVVNRIIDLGADREQSTSGTASSISADGSQDIIMSMGWVKTGANAGNLQPQFAQATADASDTKMLIGSWLFVKKLA